MVTRHDLMMRYVKGGDQGDSPMFKPGTGKHRVLVLPMSTEPNKPYWKETWTHKIVDGKDIKYRACNKKMLHKLCLACKEQKRLADSEDVDDQLQAEAMNPWQSLYVWVIDLNNPLAGIQIYRLPFKVMKEVEQQATSENNVDFTAAKTARAVAFTKTVKGEGGRHTEYDGIRLVFAMGKGQVEILSKLVGEEKARKLLQKTPPSMNKFVQPASQKDLAQILGVTIGEEDEDSAARHKAEEKGKKIRDLEDDEEEDTDKTEEDAEEDSEEDEDTEEKPEEEKSEDDDEDTDESEEDEEEEGADDDLDDEEEVAAKAKAKSTADKVVDLRDKTPDKAKAKTQNKPGADDDEDLEGDLKAQRARLTHKSKK